MAASGAIDLHGSVRAYTVLHRAAIDVPGCELPTGGVSALLPCHRLIKLHRLFEFTRPVFRHRAYAFGCLHLPDRPVSHSIEAAVGIEVLDPQTLRGQQRLTLSGVDPRL